MPAAGTLPRFSWPIVITSSTNAIRFDIAGDLATVSITPGTYYWLGDGSAADLCAALDAALSSHPASLPTVTVYLDADGTIRIITNNGPGSMPQLLLADALTTIDPVLFGFTAAAYPFAGTPWTLSSPTQVGHLWNPERIYVDDSGNYQDTISDVSVSLSGRDSTWCYAERTYRDFLVDLLPPEKLFDADSPVNEAFATFLRWLARGGEFRWTPSILVPATHLLCKIRDPEWAKGWPPKRIDQVARRYSIQFPLRML